MGERFDWKPPRRPPKDGEVIDHDPTTGMYTKFFYDEDTDTVTLKYCWKPETTQQVLEMNKALQNRSADAFKRKEAGQSDFWHVARIPAQVQLDWLLNKGVDFRNPDHWPEVKKLLNDPDYKYLRVGEFQL